MENPKHDLTGFKIDDGKYKDVVYTYGKVSPIEESEKLRLKFEYTIHENPILLWICISFIYLVYNIIIPRSIYTKNWWSK